MRLLLVNPQDETAEGVNFETTCRNGLTEVLAKKRADDILMCTVLASQTAKGAQNYLIPDGRDSVDEITQTDLLSTALVEQVNGTLPGFGAQPMTIRKGVSGSEKPSFMLLSSSMAARSFTRDPIYKSTVKDADVRGDQNAAFQGNLLNWDDDRR